MPHGGQETEIDEIVAHVQASRKYRHVCATTIRRIAAEESAKRDTLKRAIKATKSRLHQAHGAYEAKLNYARAYRDLSAAYASGDDQGIRAVCHQLLSLHASTRERLPILHRLYDAVYAHTGIPRTLLDLACGLSPLTLPWMRLSPGTAYYAYDIDGERIAFLNRFFALTDVDGCAYCQDLICDPPPQRGDLALLLKTATCLERQREGSTVALLDQLDVAHVVVTFPVKSLGQREKGMAEHYEHVFLDMIANRPWAVVRLDLVTELVFIVDKR
jgi:16S rRNA (guanine(1405)-N(7))-methyltransferase